MEKDKEIFWRTNKSSMIEILVKVNWEEDKGQRSLVPFLGQVVDPKFFY